jgi:hypothetical protein
MKLKTSYLLYGLGVLILVSQGNRVGEAVSKSERVRNERMEFSDLIRENKSAARQAEKLSEIALDRYRNNCVLVVDLESGEEALFEPGESVVSPGQQNRALRSGLFICNRLGDTAVVSENGTITDIARIATADISQFKQLLGAR